MKLVANRHDKKYHATDEKTRKEKKNAGARKSDKETATLKKLYANKWCQALEPVQCSAPIFRTNEMRCSQHEKRAPAEA